MARPARYDRRRLLPQAARRSGRLPAVKHGSALRAVSLRDGIPLSGNDRFCRINQSFVKKTMAGTVKVLDFLEIPKALDLFYYSRNTLSIRRVLPKKAAQASRAG